jgi:hypothetical protein
MIIQTTIQPPTLSIIYIILIVFVENMKVQLREREIDYVR